MKCPDCLQEMSDPSTVSCVFDVFMIGEGEEYYFRSKYHFDEPGGRCLDCGVEHGRYHHYGCDVERCPKCGLQLISCDCFPDDGPRALMSEEGDYAERIKAPVEPIRWDDGS